MINLSKKYFLAANSCEGFISYFNTAYNPKEGWKGYIIKGGPGTGKSSFMKKVALTAEEKGIATELCPCSSDPDSLDAVIMPELKIAIMDGTAPHTVDPIYPAVSDKILNFGEFWNEELIQEKSGEVINITDTNKLYHKTASRYLASAGQLLSDNYSIALKGVNREKIQSFSEKLCHRYIKYDGKKAEEINRFLIGISPKGIVGFPETLLSYCSQYLIINDNFGAVSNSIMLKIRNYALEKGHKIITFHNPFLPKLIDHIVIPELDIAFIREYFDFKIPVTQRRVHSKRFMLVENNYKRLKYNFKTAKSLLNSAIVALQDAKSTHDILESYYINAMDFNALEEFTKDFINSVIN